MQFSHVNIEHKLIGYDHVIALLRACSHDLGYSSSVNCPSNDDHVLNLILEPHNYVDDKLPKKRVMFNTEPFLTKVTISEKKYGTRYRQFLIDNHTIDYSKKNCEWLEQASPADKLKFHMPLGFHPVLLDVSMQPQKSVDVIFYGISTPRRAAMLDTLRKLGINLHASTHFYGERLLQRLSVTRILLNMHSADDGRSLEQVRLFHPIANGVLVVSECSSKTEIPRNAENHMLLCSYEDIPDQIQSVLSWSDTQQIDKAAEFSENFKKIEATTLLEEVFQKLKSL